MMKIFQLKTALRIALSILALTLAPLLYGQSGPTFGFQTTVNGDTVLAELQARDFTDIISMQFTLTWDASVMEFVALDELNLPGLLPSNWNLTDAAGGVITFSWFDPDLDGETFSDCSTLFSFKFYTPEGSVTPIEIDNSPTGDEITDISGLPVPWAQSPILCNGVGAVSGQVFRDANADCQYGTGEESLQNWKIQIDNGVFTIYQSTDEDGQYQVLLPEGTYDLTLILPNENLWSSCTPTQTITIDSTSAELIDFPVQPLQNCALMSVDLSTPFLRRCFSNNYAVQYCNEGTIPAVGAYVEIAFDSFLTVTGSSLPWNAVNGNTYTFPLGDVAPGDCQTFSVSVEVSCNAVLGQTHCTSAHIFPDDPCVPTSMWDGSDLDVTGTCEGDSVRFEIKNNGDDMAQPMEFIVIEDDMIHLTSDPVLLLSQESISFAVPANGSTWRVEMPETPNNPFSSFTAEAIEGCGANGSGSFSLGYVTQFPLDEESLAIDVDCQENIGAYDPNDKIGYPKGFCAARYIRAGQDIEYKIRFQNTGTDTAFNVVITDTLSNFLAPASVRPGSASHPYTFELSGEGVLRFSFPNIMLPDSNINEPASHGFVKFTVSQQPHNPLGTVIENAAAIYFDFNEPVITNTWRHTIGDDFVQMQGQTGDLNVSGFVRNWYDDSPVEGAALVMTNLCPEYTNADGYYAFTGIDTAQYNLTVQEGPAAPQDITVLDYVKLRGMVLGTTFPLNAYQMAAGDLNNNEVFSTLDLVEMSKLILGLPTINAHLAPKFFSADSDPTFPNLPFNLKRAYVYSPLEESLENQDFVAVQPGNVLDESMVPTVPYETNFRFETGPIQNGEVRVAVKADNFTNVYGFQFALEWEQEVLAYAGLEAGLITINANLTNAQTDGQLALIGLPEGVTAQPNETLFTLVFNGVGGSGSTTPLTMNESATPLQVVVDTCKLALAKITPASITIQEATATVDFANLGLQVKVAPNPIRQDRPLTLEVMSSGNHRLRFQLFDLQGLPVGSMVADCPAGQSVLNFQHQLPRGIYFLQTTNERGGKVTSKLVVN